MNRNVLNKIQKYVLPFLLTLSAVCVLVLLFVPMAERALEKTVRGKLDQTAAGFGLRLTRFQMVSIGLNGAHFRDVHIGKSGTKKLTIPEIHLTYTFSGIRQGRINAVRVVGLTLHAHINGKGEIQVDGLPPMSTFVTEKTSETKDSAPLPPIPDIFLDNAFVFLETPYGSTLIPGNLACRFRSNSLSLQTSLFPEGGTVTGNGKFTLPSMDGKVDVSWNKVTPGHWFSQLTKNKSLSFSGMVSGKAAITLAKGKPPISSVEAWTTGAEMTFKNIFVKLDARCAAILTGNVPEQIRLSATVSSLISENIKLLTPTAIQVEGNTLNALRISVPEIKIQAPIPVTASLSGLLSNVATIPTLHGQYFLRLPGTAAAKLFPDLPTTTAPVKVTGKFTGKMGTILPSFMLSGRISQPLSLSFPEGKLDMGSLAVIGKLAGNTEKAKISASVLVKNLTGSHRKTKVQGDKASFQFTGETGQNAVKLTVAKGTFSNFNLDDGAGDKISGISGKTQFAAGSNENGGALTVDSVITPDISFFNLQAQWEQLKTGVSFKGNAGLPITPLKLAFEGTFDPARQKDMFLMAFHLPETVLPDGTDLSPLVSSLAGFSATGNVSLTGKIAMEKDHPPTATARLDLHDMALITTDNSLKINGIDSSITFTDLLNMISVPSQKATVGKIIAGPAIFENGEIRFQLLDPDTVSVESAGCTFAHGEITVGSFLLSSTRPDMDIGIYCNSLKLTSLLNLAMGAGKAEGDGTVSGYIPLRLVDGNLIFGKGFLQSVPGSPGTIQVADSKEITGGVILAEEAIKDFSYQWARVNLESRNRNLNLLLKLDGKPNRKLPLIYDEKAGDFVRDPQNRRLVSLQGLTLDLKFVDIDINRLLKQQGKVKFTSK